MRTLKLTHQEIEILEKALAFAYNQHFKTVRNMNVIFDDDTWQQVINNANMFGDLRSKINNSEADV
jgi:hypothetical protein